MVHSAHYLLPTAEKKNVLRGLDLVDHSFLKTKPEHSKIQSLTCSTHMEDLSVTFLQCLVLYEICSLDEVPIGPS